MNRKQISQSSLLRFHVVESQERSVGQTEATKPRFMGPGKIVTHEAMWKFIFTSGS